VIDRKIEEQRLIEQIQSTQNTSIINDINDINERVGRFCDFFRRGLDVLANKGLFQFLKNRFWI